MTLHDTTRDAVETLVPGDDGYDESAQAFSGGSAPALVARPRTAAEVAAALDLGVRRGLAVSVRSGGHGPLGHATNTGGLVVDLRHLGTVEVLDRGRRLVRVGAGATWGAVANELDHHGWGITSGDTSDVGVGGLTLGGGIGWLVRRDGLTIDHLVGARIVTAAGELLSVSEDEHADLFWALRGGGGNFGIVVDLRGLRELPGLRDARRPRRRVSAGDLRPAGRREERLRPAERLRAQPQHPAGQT